MLAGVDIEDGAWSEVREFPADRELSLNGSLARSFSKSPIALSSLLSMRSIFRSLETRGQYVSQRASSKMGRHEKEYMWMESRGRILLWGEKNARALLWSWDGSVDTNNFGTGAVGARRLSVATNLAFACKHQAQNSTY